MRGTLQLSFGVVCGLSVLCTKACVLSFDDYPEGDVCAARQDAGIRASTAPDPVLRGCDAGSAESTSDPDASQGLAGAAGAGGSP